MFILFSALMLSAKALTSTYLGTYRYSVQPGQQFEHQFFNIEGVTSMDMYQGTPPYRKVEDQDMDCFWQFQDIGLQEVGQWSVTADEGASGSIVCDKMCYLTSDRTLLIIPARGQGKSQELELPFLAHGMADLTSIGMLVLWSKGREVQVLDLTSEPKLQSNGIPDALQQSLFEALDVYTDTFTLYVNVGEHVEVWDFERIDDIHLVAQITMDGAAYTKQSPKTDAKDHLTNMVVDDGLLYIFCQMKGLLVFDISDPFEITQFGITFEDQPDAFSPETFLDMSVFQDTIVLLHNNTINYQLYQFVVAVEKPHTLIMTLRVAGFIAVPVQEHQTLHLLSIGLAVLLEKTHVTLVQLQKPVFATQHQQRKHHLVSLVFSEHVMPHPTNHIYIAHGQLIQLHQGKLKSFQQSSESYDIVCNAPGYNITRNQPLSLEFAGVIRSDENCTKVNTTMKQPAFLDDILAQTETHEETNCIYTFQLIVQVEQVQNKLSKKQIVVLLVLLMVVISGIFEYVRKTCRTKMVTKTLQKFEELNSQLGEDQKERIRITHHLDDDEEWRSSARIPVQDDASFGQVIRIDHEDLI